ncbi:hypothetical protein BCR34DRAFT_499353 [Clohesyomyces aquaticus]|uniref:FCP1 homology domain-containing protein n=1 Tax=Clohesyomyces aquaticus TaxID=1231657 RepID=A0A1Y1Y978_9PLEO|nr:hypothetical protein BCR34DRAFT_499353 [Clohesyomyces aquaticus]
MSYDPVHAAADPSRPAASTEKGLAGGDRLEQANGAGTYSFQVTPKNVAGDELREAIIVLTFDRQVGLQTSSNLPPPRSSSRGPPSTEDLRRNGSRSTQGGDSAAAGESEPKKKRSFLNIPRSSSQTNDESTPTGTGLSGVTAADSESIGRGSKHSKRSFMGKRRAGSTASSKHSQPRPATSEKVEQAAPSPTQESRGGPSAGVKKSGGLLSCFSCFGSPKGAHQVDEDPATNVKPASIKPARMSQPTPVKKHDLTVPESSTADSKEPFDEKSGESYTAGREHEKPMHGDATRDTPPGESPPKIALMQAPSTSKKQSLDQPLPPLPRQPDRLDTQARPQIQVEGPTPGTTPVQPEPRVSSEGERIIHDRTPEQEQLDTDLENRDIPLSKDEVHAEGDEGEASSTTMAGKDVAATKVDLPPPPPPSERQKEVIPSASTDPSASEKTSLLPAIRPEFNGKKCLVLDLDETLVHSSFKILHQADFTIPVEIEGQYHNVYVIKRPGVDAFMKRVGELYEVVVFTASVSKYGDPLLDQLDIHGVVHHRLFRESCYNHQGNYVKDLSMIGRDLKDTIIIDNSPTSYIFHPQHAVPISSWFSDAHDNELLDLIPVLEDLASPNVADVSLVLDVAL